MKYLPLLILFIFSMLSPLVSDVICWLWLDDLQCWEFFAGGCRLWDLAEYWIAHKVIAMLVYNLSLYIFVAYLCYLTEQFLMGGSVITSKFYNIFGIVTSIVVGFIVAHIITKSDIFRISEMFEFTYYLINQ
jgi:hypothetical protein